MCHRGSDTTARNLGYCNVSFPPVKGDTVTVELIGANIDDRDVYDIVEVMGKKDDAGLDDEDREGALNIVEIGFYEWPEEPLDPDAVNRCKSYNTEGAVQSEK